MHHQLSEWTGGDGNTGTSQCNHAHAHDQSSMAPPISLVAEHHLRAPRGGSDSQQSSAQDEDLQRDAPPSFYSSAQWTTDGTSLVVGSADQTISTFVLPSDLLDTPDEPTPLRPESIVKLPEPTQVITPSPYFSLADPASQSILVACRDHPIQLYHAFPDDDASRPLAAYKLIRKETEAYVTPSSLLWNFPASHFICGSVNRLDCFDVSRTGNDGPILTIPTIPSKRHISKGHGVGMKGNVSALASSPPQADGGSIIAAGTWTRCVGLYDIWRTDKAVSNWSIANLGDSGFDVGGQGITQTLWSPCGRYLLLNERHASGLLVFDIRVTGQLLGALTGRTSGTQQKLNMDVFSGNSNEDGAFEVWAGSQDGTVQVWDSVGSSEGLISPAWHWVAHTSPVGSTVLHPGGSVVATCSGGWGFERTTSSNRDPEAMEPEPRSRQFDESSLKVWYIGASSPPVE